MPYHRYLQFSFEQLKFFCEKNGIQQIFTPPLCTPPANGKDEKCVYNVKRALKKMMKANELKKKIYKHF